MNGNTVRYDNWKINTNAGCCNSGFDLFQWMCCRWFISVYYTVNVRNKHFLIISLRGSVSSVMNVKVIEVYKVEKRYFEYVCTALVLNVNCFDISWHQI